MFASDKHQFILVQPQHKQRPEATERRPEIGSDLQVVMRKTLAVKESWEFT